jgi:hypothetical protein
MTWYTEQLTEADESELAIAHRRAKQSAHNFIRRFSFSPKNVWDPNDDRDVETCHADFYLSTPDLRGILFTITD